MQVHGIQLINLDADHSRFLIDVLESTAGILLTDEQRRAAYQLLCTLPDTCTIRDFVAACHPESIRAIALNSRIGTLLAPVAAMLSRRLNADNAKLALVNIANETASIK